MLPFRIKKGTPKGAGVEEGCIFSASSPMATSPKRLGGPLWCTAVIQGFPSTGKRFCCTALSAGWTASIYARSIRAGASK